ncbi:hypothetical protein B296_00012503 [Ensete ventricosum]|uniref:Uncharacterized protein n=1 Tax=Ensete ventricosum TaxID=4639 RepID=A0A427A4X3_ENSVE|nr:hypothetical protein B296_00012503 [Ensete ventricosum]
MEVPLLVEVDAAAVKHEEDCLVWDAAGLRDTEVAGSDCDGKQRKGGNHVDVLRRKSRRWALITVNRVNVLQQEVEEDRRKGAAGRGAVAAETIAGARRKKRREEEGSFAGTAFTGAFARSETAGANVPKRWRGWRPGRLLGWGISLEIYSSEIEDNKVATTIAALAGRSCPTTAAL